MKKAVRFLPLLILIAALVCVFVFGWYKYLSFDALKTYRQTLLMWTQMYYLWVVLGFIAIYIIAVALSVPGAVFLTLLGGFLFGYFAGTIYVVIAATIGASLIFLAVKTSLGELLAKKASGWIERLEEGFQKNAFNYLLVLRLIPIFPFWVINIVAGLLNVRFRTFLLATFFGIIPGSFVYVSVGNGLSAAFASNIQPNLGIIFKPEILLPLIALAILSIVPIAYKKIKAKRN